MLAIYKKEEHTLFPRPCEGGKGREDQFYDLAREIGRALLPLGVRLNEVHPIEGPLLSRGPWCPRASRRRRFFKAIVGRTEVIPFPSNFFA